MRQEEKGVQGKRGKPFEKRAMKGVKRGEGRKESLCSQLDFG